MKIGIAVAGPAALPSAFVVLRDDLCRCVDRASAFGYDGVELALLSAGEVDVPRMKRRLSATGLEIPCISSGQVFAADHLYFTHPESAVREAAVDRIIGMIRLAAEFGAKVNTGRVRGLIHDGETLETARQRYLSCLDRCADVAEQAGVELIVEPVNRYELNLADSNRLAPGWGHMPFDEIFQILADIGYDGYLTAEILPKPDPDQAAAQAARYLLGRLGAKGGLYAN